MELRDYFIKDLPPRQRQYEAIRAVAFNEATMKDIAERFGYTPQTLRMLINRLVRDKLQLFPDIKKGPGGRHIPSETEKIIIQLRRKRMLNSREITEELNRSNISIGVRTVERILTDAGFPKLRRRTDKERGLSKEGAVLPKRSMSLSMQTLQPFRSDCQVAGIFLFLPCIPDTGILDIVQGCALPRKLSGRYWKAAGGLVHVITETDRQGKAEPYKAVQYRYRLRGLCRIECAAEAHVYVLLFLPH
jgi:transposase